MRLELPVSRFPAQRLAAFATHQHLRQGIRICFPFIRLVAGFVPLKLGLHFLESIGINDGRPGGGHDLAATLLFSNLA
ncbi:MAG: hypothetical protein A2603_14930 [Bdellovibrionales bacterium RIFOXYD1_FULL_55_31]|nr:MAG: hypothetical protein A2603_14930 [Bdellovibrionales bacterium RIFOXYD1_FULL_55_31]